MFEFGYKNQQTSYITVKIKQSKVSLAPVKLWKFY